MYVTLLNTHDETDELLNIIETPRKKPSLGSVRFLPAGSNLFHEGDEAQFIYEVRSGVLRLTRVLENGKRQVIAFGYPGDFVGFPNGTQYHTDCDVISSTELIAHRRSALDMDVGDEATRRRLLNAALREISGMQDHFMMLARKSATEKVASFLSVLSERVGVQAGAARKVNLSMRRADIADFLGLTTETVSRTFTQLRKAGIIAIETAQVIVILDQRALSDAAETE